MKLKGQTAVVTGGGRDIGKAVALRYAAEGANVAINYFSSSTGADEAVAEIKAAGGNAFAMQGDLTKPADVKALADATVEAFGGINVLFNNSGGLVSRKKIVEMDLEHWHAVMDLNMTSMFLMTQACIPHIKNGAIVNMASQAARDGGGPGAIPYATSKGAVMTFTRGLAKELGPDIRVNAMCAGMIDTDFHNVHTPDAGRRAFEANALVKRQGHTDDAANLALFLSCDDSAFMTGTNIDINGGMLFS